MELVFFYAAIAIIFLKIKFIHTIHNEPSKETQGIRKYINSFLFRYKKVKTVILGQKLVNSFIDYYGFEPDMIIPNGVCINRECINSNYVSHNKEVFSFISVGRFDKQKNFNRLLKSFKKLLDDGYNTSLSIYCSVNENDIEFQRFKEDIKNIPVSLYVNRVDLSQEYPRYNCFVLASDYEGLPLTILESIGYGIPIVSTDVGCISDVVTKDIGYICKPNSIELYKSMKSIIDNVDNFSKDNIREIYEKEYSLKIMSDRYVDSYGTE
ncbi:glycosyltransferase [Photobacterium kishitanii]|uniref:glycosyltransferase n=1 Tax=Photobacterium kishitanii TaxID=318456 RepID=UPI0006989777|nr:glycosyltransferase [Photobacterium kishitanii]